MQDLDKGLEKQQLHLIEYLIEFNQNQTNIYIFSLLFPPDVLWDLFELEKHKNKISPLKWAISGNSSMTLI